MAPLLYASLQFNAFDSEDFDDFLHVWHSVTFEFAKYKSSVDLDFESSCLKHTGLDHVSNEETSNAVHDFAFLYLLNEVRCWDAYGLTNGVTHH